MQLVVHNWIGDAGEFKESDHPRGQPGNAGKFALAGGSGVAAASSRGAGAKQRQIEEAAAYSSSEQEKADARRSEELTGGETYEERVKKRENLTGPEQSELNEIMERRGAAFEAKKKLIQQRIEEKYPSTKNNAFKAANGSFTTRFPSPDKVLKSQGGAGEIIDLDSVGVEVYGNVGFEDVTRGLREGKLTDAAKRDVVKLDRILGDHSLREPMTVYRTLHGRGADQLQHLGVGEVIADKSFVATGLDPDYLMTGYGNWKTHGADDELYVMMKIDLPKGQNGAFVYNEKNLQDPQTGGLPPEAESMTKQEKWRNESEFLLPRDLKMKINKVERTNSATGERGQTIVVYHVSPE